MSARVSLGLGEDGELLAVKTAFDTADATLLATEAEAIQRAAHEGVVTLHDTRSTAAGFQLRTLWVGTRSTADLRSTTPERAGAICAQLAQILGDLHTRGLVHGRVEAAHVLLELEERPVLCSLGSAGPAGDPPPGSSRPRSPSDDVAGVGRLLSHLLSLPLPAGRPVRGTDARASERCRAALLGLAERAAAPDPTTRPSAPVLSEALRGVLDASPAPGSNSSHESSPRRRSRRTLAAGALGVVSVLAGVGAVASTAGSAPEAVVASEQGHEANVAAVEPDDARNLPPLPTPPVIVVDGHRYAVGRAGDETLVIDRECGGEPSVALLRPSTGAVFLFELPLPKDVPLTSVPSGYVEPRSHLAAPSTGQACPELTAIAPDGTRQDLLRATMVGLPQIGALEEIRP